MKERELVKIASDNPAFPNGYYTQFRDCMKPGDIEYGVKKVEPEKVDPVKTEPIKPKKKRK